MHAICGLLLREAGAAHELPAMLAALALGLPPEQFLRGEWNRWLM